MNKKKINDMIPSAYKVLGEVGIADDKYRVLKAYRGQIATFGAAIIMGSLTSAVAFFSKKGNSDKENSSGVDRQKILNGIIKLVLTQEEIKSFENKDYGAMLMCHIGKKTEKIAQEEIINAAIALKLAMNLYELDENDGDASGKS